MRNSELIELIRRLISVAIVVGGLYAILLMAFPYTRLPGHFVAVIGNQDPTAGMLVAGLCFLGVLTAMLRFREIFDAALGGAYRLVRIVI